MTLHKTGSGQASGGRERAVDEGKADGSGAAGGAAKSHAGSHEPFSGEEDGDAETGERKSKPGEIENRKPKPEEMGKRQPKPGETEERKAKAGVGAREHDAEKDHLLSAAIDQIRSCFRAKRVLRIFTRKTRPEFGLDCPICLALTV